MRRIVSLTRRAIEDYDMICEGDKVCVGVSGGKDSLVLLKALAELSRYYPKKFTVCAVTLDLGYHPDYSGIQKMCDELGIEYYIKQTDIKEIIFDIRKEANPCSLCAKMRRAALNEAALEMGSNKVALGHHNDDVLETFMLSLMYEGRIHCFSPVTYLDRTKVYQIRPMIYVREKDVKGAVRKLELPVVSNNCPANGVTKRQYMKELITSLERENHPGLRKRLFTAVQTSGIHGWDMPEEQ